MPVLRPHCRPLCSKRRRSVRASAPRWHADILGPDYQALTLHLRARAVPSKDGNDIAATPGDSTAPAQSSPAETAEGEPVPVSYRATLVRHRPARRQGGETPSPPATKPAVLFIHGWSDYFYNTGLAEFFTGHGYSFYALDLHNHGRSLTSHELGGYVADLADYDAEILAAHAVIAQEISGSSVTSGTAGGNVPILLMGHSTGGLIATLWAHHHPGLVSHLILNSPWLEIQGGAAIRRAATPLVQLADLRPLMRMRVPERSFYWRGISDEAYGEWPVDKKLRPPHAFPVRAGWMKAILAAQQEVAAGLKLPMPVLVLLSTKSMLGPIWSDAMLRADVVLDVRSLALRTLSLGNSVTLERLEGALHEVLLSPQPVRDDGYARMERWLRGYVGQ
ncbi:alpha/beta hydrolase [Arthrobacter glacialis]|uniref:Alpha/beta hydrolase n=1 Tax=Arthrobacter glacialis TaxID=1664 RepID=A0A2S3ZW67_ARTGL|nr:alpha/beta hydrolase [Arthrobacter glacialis]